MWSWFEDEVIDSGRLPLFLRLLAFVVTFGVTRGITRSIRTGRGPFSDNVSDSGLHIHHAVPGVVLLTVGATGMNRAQRRRAQRDRRRKPGTG